VYQTIEEIEKEYYGNFVCITNCKTTDDDRLLGGEVLAFGKDKMEIQEIWSKAPEWSFYRWFGDFPDVPFLL